MTADDQTANVVRELRGIKYLLALVLLGVVAFGVIAFTATSPGGEQAYEGVAGPVSDRGPFYREANDLLMRGAYDDLVAIGEARMNEFPGDPYVYWALGMAYYRLRNYAQALEYLEEAQRMVPQWEAQFTGAYISAAKMFLD